MTRPTLRMVFRAGSVRLRTRLGGHDSRRRPGIKSSGQATADGWTLAENGYVGTFIHLDSPGDVSVAINALGSGTTKPRVNIIINDAKATFEIADKLTNDQHTFSLPEGTHFIRVEFVSRALNPDQTFTVRDLTINGAQVCNELNDANALAASEAYIRSCRTADVIVRLPAIEPGTAAQGEARAEGVQLRHERAGYREQVSDRQPAGRFRRGQVSEVHRSITST